MNIIRRNLSYTTNNNDIDIIRQNLPYATYSIDEILKLNLDEFDKNKRYSFNSLSGNSSALDLVHAKILKAKIQEIIGNIPKMNFTTQLHKLIYTYDYILKNVKYHVPECGFRSELHLLNGYESDNCVAGSYGALINGKALCGGMAEAIVLILKHPSFNINCNLVLGKNCGVPHAFVRVNVGGNYYYLDAAAELKFDPNTQIDGFKSDYFLISGNKLIQKGYDFERSSIMIGNRKVITDAQNYDRRMINSGYDKLNEKRINIINRNEPAISR